jgi:hypothetical protein
MTNGSPGKEGRWQSVKSAPIRLSMKETDTIGKNRPGAKDLEQGMKLILGRASVLNACVCLYHSVLNACVCLYRSVLNV